MYSMRHKHRRFRQSIDCPANTRLISALSRRTRIFWPAGVSNLMSTDTHRTIIVKPNDYLSKREQKPLRFIDFSDFYGVTWDRLGAVAWFTWIKFKFICRKCILFVTCIVGRSFVSLLSAFSSMRSIIIHSLSHQTHVAIGMNYGWDELAPVGAFCDLHAIHFIYLFTGFFCLG